MKDDQIGCLVLAALFAFAGFLAVRSALNPPPLPVDPYNPAWATPYVNEEK